MRIPRDPKCLQWKIHDDQILPGDPLLYILLGEAAEVCDTASKIRNRVIRTAAHTIACRFRKLTPYAAVHCIGMFKYLYDCSSFHCTCIRSRCNCICYNLPCTHPLRPVVPAQYIRIRRTPHLYISVNIYIYMYIYLYNTAPHLKMYTGIHQ